MRLAILLILLAAASVYAFRRGGKAEKQIAIILVAIQLLDLSYHHLLGFESRYGHVDAWHAFNDGWALLATLWVALTANRFWPLWIAAFQVMACLAHYVRLIDPEAPVLTYSIMIRAPLWFQVAILAFGTWNFARKRRAASLT